ncbi:hypothetical protein [Microseira sp. BLCC-F43]
MWRLALTLERCQSQQKLVDLLARRISVLVAWKHAANRNGSIPDQANLA